MPVTGSLNGIKLASRQDIETIANSPSRSSLEPVSATSLVVSLSDIMEDTGISVKGRVDEANGALSSHQAVLVDPGKDRSKDGS
jgi:hypothetical protein